MNAGTDGQKQMWDRHYAQTSGVVPSAAPSPFAREVLAGLPCAARILELGCGAGLDAAAFARNGHNVVATDFSAVILAGAARRLGQVSGLSFVLLDTSRPLCFAGNTFDVVYARLSLHYFRDAVTRQVMAEIQRVLRPGGRLCFLCKSTGDSVYGQGTEIEPDMFDNHGHIRHFFSYDYAQSLLAGRFVPEAVTATPTAGADHAFVQVIAGALHAG
jgi:SAM-dependent methyltransferase